MTENERLDFMEELLLSCHNLYLWKFSRNFNLIQSNCPSAETLETLFAIDNGQEEILKWTEIHQTPMVLTNSMSIIWTIDRSPKTEEICILGPYFTDDTAIRAVRKRIQSMPLADEDKASAVSLVNALPVVSQSKLIEYSIMLHRTIALETISVSDLMYRNIGGAGEIRRNPASHKAKNLVTIHGTYDSEQEMLRAVREGDIANFQKIMNRMAKIGSMGQMADKNDQPRLMKNAVLANIVLFSRAAVDGGLPPDLSLSLSDRYMQGVEACRNIQELRELAITMQKDYVTRVHRIRQTEQGVSNLSRSVLAWLDVHLEEKIRIEDIAASLGYSTYYLSRRFKKECGKSISESLKEKRIERAKFLLQNTDLPVHEIADRLQFNSPSYFTDNFRKITGVRPSEYRSARRHP